MVTNETTYTEILNDLYDAITGLSTQGYQWADTDAWLRARVPGEWTQHLHCWIDLGLRGTYTRVHIQHECSLIVAMRYLAEDDGTSQARMHAAINAAMFALLGARIRRNARVTSLGGWTLDPITDPSWVLVTIPFTLSLPTGA